MVLIIKNEYKIIHIQKTSDTNTLQHKYVRLTHTNIHINKTNKNLRLLLSVNFGFV